MHLKYSQSEKSLWLAPRSRTITLVVKYLWFIVHIFEDTSLSVRQKTQINTSLPVKQIYWLLVMQISFSSWLHITWKALHLQHLLQGLCSFVMEGQDATQATHHLRMWYLLYLTIFIITPPTIKSDTLQQIKFPPQNLVTNLLWNDSVTVTSL